MKMIEISYRANVNELNKLNAKLERAQKALQKKQDAAEKIGVADWTWEDWNAFMQTVETKNGWIVNKEDVKKNGAWSDLWDAKRDIKYLEEQIANAEKRFEKAERKLEEYYEELAKIEDLKAKEELFKKEFEQEQKEWAKDGITLTSRYTGITPNGRRFWIERNNGWTERSLHCFTLTLTNAEGIAYTVFTSGEFWRAYGVVKNS